MSAKMKIQVRPNIKLKNFFFRFLCFSIRNCSQNDSKHLLLRWIF